MRHRFRPGHRVVVVETFMLVGELAGWVPVGTIGTVTERPPKPVGKVTFRGSRSDVPVLFDGYGSLAILRPENVARLDP